MAWLFSLTYHVIILVATDYFILSDLIYVGCERISICHDHSEHRGSLLFFLLFNTGRCLPTELPQDCFHAPLHCLLSL